jgi:alpha,alpha-trehalose-phosphate synthase [UDP-forming]
MGDIHWDKHSLYSLARDRLSGRRLIVVSNREPYIHTRSGGDITYRRPVSGLTEALDPVMRAAGGCWIAYGSGDADRQTVDSNDRIAVPPDKPEYTLRRIWLTEEEIAGYYRGFSNEGLWPLCHITFTPPVFRRTDWETYRDVNRKFADAVAEEITGTGDIVLVQDYHFALLPGMIKERVPGVTVGQFWHIPWVPGDIFRICPWRDELLEGMLGNDLLGFHIPGFCENFLETAGKIPGAETDPDTGTVTYKGKQTLVAPFPISVDFDGLTTGAWESTVDREMDILRRELKLEGKCVGIGMDRIDYTKGIPQRLEAIDRFLSDNPSYPGKVVFIQAGIPSRTGIGSYQQLASRVDEMAGEINAKYGNEQWRPLIMLSEQLTVERLNALRRLADFCIVSSLHDGMNLVAKEYVAARADGKGVLLLSEFTGAAEELRRALLINPYDIAGFANAIKTAIEMPGVEQEHRMKAMRETVSANNIYGWGANIVSRLVGFSEEHS